MGILRGFGIFSFVVLLIPVLILANAMVGVDRTVLNEDFVTETLEEEQTYDTVADIVDQQLPNETDQMPVDPRSIVDDEFIQSEVERNIGSFYDYLYQRDDQLDLYIDLSEIHEAVTDNINVSNQDILQSIDPQLLTLNESQEQFQAQRTAFREQQYQRIQDETDGDLSTSELEQALQEQKDQIRDELDITQQTDVPSEIEAEVQQLADLKADALLNESITYQKYSTELTSTMDEVAPALLETMLGETVPIPRQIDITERLGPEMIEQMDKGREYLPLVRSGIYAMPVLALILMGLLVFLTRTRAGGAASIGVPVLIAGGASTAAFLFAQNTATEQLSTRVPDQAPDAAANLVTGLIENVLDAFLTQSTLLVGIGGILILAAIGLVIYNRVGPDDTGEDDVAVDPDDENEEDDTDEEPDTDDSKDDETEDEAVDDSDDAS